MPAYDPVRLVVSLGSETDPDPETVDRDLRRLVSEVSELNVESVEPAPGGAPPAGAKAGEFAAAGAVLVSLLPAAVPQLIAFLQAWTLRGSGRTVKIHAASGNRTFDVEYSPSSTSPEELREMLASLSRALDVTNNSA